MQDKIRLHEVSPRDGLQNEPDIVSTDAKLALIERLVAAGFKDIEVTSFVSPRFIPQLADAADLARRLRPVEGVRFWALVPNPVGIERAKDSGIRAIATVLSASETHNQRNVNRAVAESLSALEGAISIARSEGFHIRSYVSTAFGCSYEGDVPQKRVVELAVALRSAGAHEITLGDTTGMADPEQVMRVVGALGDSGIPPAEIACHFHDTCGTALANAYAAWRAGIRVFDGSVAGIGGCPYAPGAVGNAASEDLLHLFQRLGCDTGVDLERACEAGEFMETTLGRRLPGRYHRYWAGKRAAK